MVKWRIITWVGFLLCLCSALPASLQSQSTLSAREIWQYGRGVIYDFDWREQMLIFPAGGGIWQANPLSSQPPIEEAADFFPLLTSPDGRRIVTQGRSELLIRDTHTGEVVTRIPRSYIDRTSASWQPHTSLLTTLGYNEDNPPEHRYYLELWDTDSGELVATVGGYADRIKAFSWHPAGELLAVSLISDIILIEDVTRGEQMHELRVGSSANTVAWSPDGSRLAATANSQSPVHLWRMDRIQPVTADNQPAFIVTLAWNAAGVRLAGALNGGGVGIWDVETGEFVSFGIETDDGADRVIERIVWQGNLLAALDRTQRLRVWNVDENELVWDSTEHQFHASVQEIAVSQEGEFAALAYRNSREIDIVDGVTGTLLQTLETPSPLNITEMAWNPSGDKLAIGRTLAILLWQFDAESAPRLIQVDDLEIPEFSWSSTGVLAVASRAWREEELRFIDGETGELLPESHEILGLMYPRWSPDGRYIALYRYNPPSNDASIPPYQIGIWDRQRDVTTTMNFPHSDETLLKPSQYFLWLPDSSGLTGFATSGALWQWDVGTREADIIVSGQPVDTMNQPFPLSINERGDLLAVSNLTTNGQLHILDAESGGLLLTLDDLTSGPRFFVWGGEDTLFVYDGVLRAYRIS